MRSLHFNLKDPHNAELRAHVLRGHISPDNFVQMTATELASKVYAISFFVECGQFIMKHRFLK